MKNSSGIVVGHGLIETSPVDSPNKTRFSNKLVLVATSALIYWAALGLAQPAKAESPLRVADINSVVRGLPQPANSETPAPPQQQYDNEAAFSTLSAFAQQIAAQAPATSKTADAANPQFDDKAISALQDFAQRLGATQPETVKSLPKLAEAGSLLEFLKGGAKEAPASSKPNGPVAGGTTSSTPVAATFLGDKACLTCHTNQTEMFEKTLMGRIGKTQKGKFACENCHGPGSAHVKAGGGRGVGGIISFRPEDQARTAEENNGVCLACHQKGARNNWPGSTHETRGLMCTNCHTVMKNVSRKHQLKTAFEPDTCFQCHKDRKAQIYRSSHMPIREGKVVCSDCHNPHGSITEALLKKTSVNEVCYTCHAERRGPFLFEHAPVRESCLNCHDPHGSINEYSLKLSRPRLCFECHSLGHGSTTGINATRTVGVACQNCHTNIHGSNSPAGAFFWR